jgi:hypothetical protein
MATWAIAVVAVPVPSLARTPDHVAGADFRLRAALALGPADTGGDDQRLAERMRVPVCARARLKGYDRAPGTPRPIGLERAVDPNIAREDLRPSFAGYHLYYPSRRQPSAAFVLLVDALRYRA